MRGDAICNAKRIFGAEMSSLKREYAAAVVSFTEVKCPVVGKVWHFIGLGGPFLFICKNLDTVRCVPSL